MSKPVLTLISHMHSAIALASTDQRSRVNFDIEVFGKCQGGYTGDTLLTPRVECTRATRRNFYGGWFLKWEVTPFSLYYQRVRTC
ncbi:hypothetical protein HYDPIDRAFT_104526 [Hydnomerulius pinastri MD-312]|nr:hypothetical protein HYDPIDRAFT_104526 [Hydnomerulius pinastri MD-312]